MSFRLYKNENSESPATEFIPCDDITINVGTALCLNGGHAVLATGTNKPTHISISNQTVAADGTPVPVFRVKECMIFESVLSDLSIDCLFLLFMSHKTAKVPRISLGFYPNRT